jgi:hypothetical protein
MSDGALTRANDGNSDFSLKKMVFSPEISAKVQSGAVKLVIVPFDPQPVIDAQELAACGMSLDDAPALMYAVRLAFRIGLIGRDIAPIQQGHAFELLQELPPQKLAHFGTGRVKRLDIARFADLGEHDWQACGYSTKVEFHKYWAGSLPGTPAESNPWCWLIQFEFKG